MRTSRRTFLKLSGATTLCACASVMGLTGCSGAPRACEIPVAPEGSVRREGGRIVLSLAEIDALVPVGGAVCCTFEGAGGQETPTLIVVHSEPETYRAFADRCTHNGKPLDYLPEGQILQCRSRKARFDLNGEVLRGPAEQALRAYPTRLQGHQLAIKVL